MEWHGKLIRVFAAVVKTTFDCWRGVLLIQTRSLQPHSLGSIKRMIRISTITSLGSLKPNGYTGAMLRRQPAGKLSLERWWQKYINWAFNRAAAQRLRSVIYWRTIRFGGLYSLTNFNDPGAKPGQCCKIIAATPAFFFIAAYTYSSGNFIYLALIIEKELQLKVW